ncbi:MAG TPA: insulinase family protein [Gemmatimonadaceae bacterium]
MRKLLLALVVATLSAPVLHAQTLDRSKRPVAEPGVAFRFPEVVSEKLPNGLTVRVIEDHSVPVVAVRVVLGVDSTYDPPGKEGLFAVTMGALRDANATPAGDSLVRAAALIGTPVTPTSFTTTSSSFPAALSILGRMLATSSLDSGVVERRKVIQAAAARRVAQTPSTPARHLFYQLLYGANDPFTRSLVPTEAGVQSITASDVQSFHARFFSPAAITLVIAGDVNPNAALAEARKVFGKWESTPAPVNPAESEALPTRDTVVIHLIDAPGQQAYVYIGGIGPRRVPADAAAAELLGAVATSRMQQELRDRRALIYSGAIGLTWRRPTQPSAFVGSAVVDPRKVDSVLISWVALLRAVRDSQPPTGPEIDAGRRARVGSLAARFDGADSVAARVVELVRDGLTPEYYSDWTAQMTSSSVGGVAEAARRVIDLDQLIVVVSGDRRVIEPALRASRLGPIVVVDTDGRQKP